MMASGKNAKRNRNPAPVVSRRQGLPWITIGAVVVVVALAASIFAFVYSKQHAKNVIAAQEAADQAALAPWAPTATNMDPSTKIPGIYVGKSVVSNGTISYVDYKAALHVEATQRVAYDRFPPVGGPHDAEWAACNGVVYATAVRDENMVHTLEHGAIWIAYNPTKLAAGDLDILKKLVVGKTFISMSPYPTLDKPISLQAWGHQLKVDTAADPRVKEFITALQQNPYTTPEANGTCDQPTFDTTSPPPFDPSARGSDSIPLDGSGLTAATSEMVATPTDSAAVSSTVPATTGATTASGSVSATGSATASSAATGATTAGPTSPATSSSP